MKFTDITAINYQIEIKHQPQDLLETLKNRQIIPKTVFDFYQTIKGKNYQNYRHGLKASRIKVPYYDAQLKPTSSYATFSVGVITEH